MRARADPSTSTVPVPLWQHSVRNATRLPLAFSTVSVALISSPTCFVGRGVGGEG